MAVAFANHPFTVVTVTPSKLDSYQRCPRAYEMQSKSTFTFETTAAQERGKYLHEIVCRYNRCLVAGVTPSVPGIVAAAPIPPCFRDESTLEASIIEFAERSLGGYAMFVRDEEITIVAAEQFVRTAERPVLGMDGARVRFSGRFDAVGKRASDGIPLCLDIKTGFLCAVETLRELGSTFAYSLLMRYEYGVESAEIIHLAPADGAFVSVRLDRSDLDGGTLLCRSIVRDTVSGAFAASTGAHCAWCRVADECPIMMQRPNKPDWDLPL